MESNILRVPRESHWLGQFRIEYDGKYISIYGEDSNYPGYGYGTTETEPSWFEEMCLAGSIAEGGNLNPEITDVTDKYIYINIGDERKSLAWCKLNKFEGVFEPCEY